MTARPNHPPQPRISPCGTNWRDRNALSNGPSSASRSAFCGRSVPSGREAGRAGRRRLGWESLEPRHCRWGWVLWPYEHDQTVPPRSHNIVPEQSNPHSRECRLEAATGGTGTLCQTPEAPPAGAHCVGVAARVAGDEAKAGVVSRPLRPSFDTIRGPALTCGA